MVKKRSAIFTLSNNFCEVSQRLVNCKLREDFGTVARAANASTDGGPPAIFLGTTPEISSESTCLIGLSQDQSFSRCF